MQEIPPVPPETGGLLGGKNGIITHYIWDQGLLPGEYGRYAPNCVMFNQTIHSWSLEDVQLCGIYHSHFPGGDTLSNGDMSFIRVIMEQMPVDIVKLYFPIILPGDRMIVYRADRNNGDIEFACEDIEIV